MAPSSGPAPPPVRRALRRRRDSTSDVSLSESEKRALGKTAESASLLQQIAPDAPRLHVTHTPDDLLHHSLKTSDRLLPDLMVHQIGACEANRPVHLCRLSRGRIRVRELF